MPSSFCLITLEEFLTTIPAYYWLYQAIIINQLISAINTLTIARTKESNEVDSQIRFLR